MGRKDHSQTLAYLKAYRLAHLEEVTAGITAWRAANREKVRAYSRAWRLRHREQVRLSGKRYREENREKIRLKSQRYNATHPEVGQILAVRRRARKAAAPINDLTRAQWREIKAHYGHRCVYCGRKMKRLTMDHIIPLFKGGSHTFSNIVPACGTCNSSKGTNPPPIPVQPLLLTLAPSRVAS